MPGLVLIPVLVVPYTSFFSTGVIVLTCPLEVIAPGLKFLVVWCLMLLSLETVEGPIRCPRATGFCCDFSAFIPHFLILFCRFSEFLALSSPDYGKDFYFYTLVMTLAF